MEIMVVLVEEQVMLLLSGGLGNTPSTSPSQGNNGGTRFCYQQVEVLKLVVEEVVLVQ
jgi:hypothetical protein